MFTYYKKYNYCEEFIFNDDELKEISEKYKNFLAINQINDDDDNISIFNDFLIDDIIIRNDKIVENLNLYQSNLKEFYKKIKKYM